MADELQVHDERDLERPIMITAFRGWNDGGQGASLAAGYLARLWDADRIAEIDPEDFFDFQATRPHVKLVEGLTRHIDWPETAFYVARPEGFDRDVVLLLGVEPNLRWQTFTRLIVDYAQELGVELVVTLGSLLADVPHTRDTPVTGSATDAELVQRLGLQASRYEGPTGIVGVELVVTLGSLLADVPHTRDTPVTGSATDAELVQRLGLQASRYEGPTGIVGVLHDVCRREDLPSVSLWAAVPHYVSLTPSPRAALALCERLGSLLDADIDVGELREASAGYVEQVSAAVASDADTQAYVEDLEQRADEIDEADLPSGEALAAELTRFLRERDRENGPPDAATDQ